MIELKKIDIDLAAFKIILYSSIDSDPLIVHFDKPSRKYYFSLIALIIHDIQTRSTNGFCYIRKHEDLLQRLDKSLAGRYASKNVESMWEKIRKAWHYTLPDLDKAAHFKIEDRDLTPPYEKGGYYSYECTEEECDAWANLFTVDSKKNKWRYKFAADAVGVPIQDINLKYNEFVGQDAWNAFLEQVQKNSLNLSSTQDDTMARTDATKTDYRPASFISHEIKDKLKQNWTWVLLALLLVAGTTIAGLSLMNRYTRPDKPSSTPSQNEKYAIVVLPFVNISADPKQEFLCDGISEELINALAKIKDLRIISRTSSFYFKGKDISTQAIGDQLNVDAVLEGGVRTANGRLRVTARLIDAKDETSIWAGTFDREITELFSIQEDISGAIIDRLNLEVLPGKDLSQYVTPNMEAYNHYLKGRYFWEQMSLEKALYYFEKAISVEPDYAMAYTGVSDTYHLMAILLDDIDNTYTKKSMDAAQKAISLDPNLAEALVSMGWCQFHFEWDWQRAEATLQRALSLKPSLTTAHRYYSVYLRNMGRMEEALLASNKALELDPLSPLNNVIHGLLLNAHGRSQEATKHLQNTLDLYPNHPEVMMLLGLSHVANKSFGNGIQLLLKANDILGNESPYIMGLLGYAYAISGQTNQAESMLTKMLSKREKGYFSATIIAHMYSGLGQKEKAFEWLAIAIQEKDMRLHNLKVSSPFKVLRDDPRWDVLLGELNLR